jgi:hypothetical protein
MCVNSRLCEHVEGDGATAYEHAVALGCEGIVSKRKGSRYVSGRSRDWIKTKNPDAPAARREAEDDLRRDECHGNADYENHHKISAAAAGSTTPRATARTRPIRSRTTRARYAATDE